MSHSHQLRSSTSLPGLSEDATAAHLQPLPADPMNDAIPRIEQPIPDNHQLISSTSLLGLSEDATAAH